jgi:hypothetical protein
LQQGSLRGASGGSGHDWPWSREGQTATSQTRRGRDETREQQRRSRLEHTKTSAPSFLLHRRAPRSSSPCVNTTLPPLHVLAAPPPARCSPACLCADLIDTRAATSQQTTLTPPSPPPTTPPPGHPCAHSRPPSSLIVVVIVARRHRFFARSKRRNKRPRGTIHRNRTACKP